MNGHTRFLLLLFVAVLSTCFLATSAWSATIQLSGTVRSSQGLVLSGVQVKLLHLGVSQYTGATGSFSFSGNVGVNQAMADQPEYSAPSFVEGTRFRFSTTTPGEKVTMSFFDVQGHLLQTIVRTFSSAGPQEISVGRDKRATGIHFVSFNSESRSGSFSSLSAGADLFSSKTSSRSAGGSFGSLAKSEAVYVDTVQAIRSNFKTATIPITTYVQKMDTIVLQVIDSCLPAVAASGDGHGAGTDCMAAGCHVPGNCGPGTPNPSAPVVTACGTLYSSLTGGSPVAGATIRLIDSLGHVATLNTSPTGVFWIGENCNGYFTGACVPNDSTTKWVSAAASKCPNFAQMTGKASGHCSACHTNTNQIHLP